MGFWFQGLTVPGVVRTPVAPKASAERMRVPRLPGSWRPTAMRMRGVARDGEHLLEGADGGDEEGGDALGGAGFGDGGEDVRGEAEEFDAGGEVGGGSRRSERKTVLRAWPLRRASSRRWSPSMAMRPLERRALDWKAARSCLTRAFERLVTTGEAFECEFTPGGRTSAGGGRRFSRRDYAMVRVGVAGVGGPV